MTLPTRDRLKRWLTLTSWRNHRLVDEQGRLVNEANALGANVATMSRLGRLYRAYWTGMVPASTTYDFIVRPPAGVKLYGIVRNSTVFDGRLNVTFLVGGAVGTVESSATGYNFDETLNDTAVSTLDRVSGLTGASQRSSGAPIISPATGPTRLPSAQSEAGAHPAFDNVRFPVFRYENPSTEAAVSLWLDILWEEVEE